MDERGGLGRTLCFFRVLWRLPVIEPSTGCNAARWHTLLQRHFQTVHMRLRSSPGLESDWSHARGCMETFTENLHLRVADAARHFLYLHRRGAVQVLGCM